MPLFEHLKDIVFTPSGSGGSISSVPCQSATVEWSGDELTHSHCDQGAIDYRGVTGLTIPGAIELAGQDFSREIGAMEFNGDLAEALNAELTEVGDPDIHSADGFCWAKLIRIRSRSVTADVTYRSLRDGIANAMGDSGTLKVGYGLALAREACIAGGGADVIVSVDDMIVVGGTPVNAQHNAYGEGSLSLAGTNQVKDIGGRALSGLHVGDLGTLSFSVPSADGGSPLAVTLSNVIITEKKLRFEHGGMLRESFSYQAYSSDGDTSPLEFT